MERLLLKAEEAAELLGLGRAKVYMMMASGELPTVRIGRSVRIPLDKLREWVANRVGNSPVLSDARHVRAFGSHPVPGGLSDCH